MSDDFITANTRQGLLQLTHDVKHILEAGPDHDRSTCDTCRAMADLVKMDRDLHAIARAKACVEMGTFIEDLIFVLCTRRDRHFAGSVRVPCVLVDDEGNPSPIHVQVCHEGDLRWIELRPKDSA